MVLQNSSYSSTDKVKIHSVAQWRIDVISRLSSWRIAIGVIPEEKGFGKCFNYPVNLEESSNLMYLGGTSKQHQLPCQSAIDVLGGTSRPQGPRSKIRDVHLQPTWPTDSRRILHILCRSCC